MTEDEYQSYRISVPEEFREVFTHFYVARNNSERLVTKNLLPSFQTILIFNFGNGTKLISDRQTEIMVDKCLVLGPVKKLFTYTIPAGGQILVANFKDDAFYRFFGTVALNSFLAMNPDDLLNENCFTFLWHQLAGKTNEERIKVILDFCKPYLKERGILADLLANFSEEAINPIKAVAGKTRQSERTIQQKHKELFGFTSKEKIRYQRFLKTIKYLQDNPQMTNWFDVINETGYYDQSQLIHDFQHYLNLSPKQYLSFQHDICIANL